MEYKCYKKDGQYHHKWWSDTECGNRVSSVYETKQHNPDNMIDKALQEAIQLKLKEEGWVALTT